ncbi:kinesin-like protein KIF21A isoform X2 [Nematostella vectensis]|uniref:kinesin-like protein KIF21A isoform X2 n=1 Tax=Nematostella vectensis TaxID=45351 RepID=UPI002076DAF1|nr:kinesin-like protein KIF21A isoform X2 [Nematostella vectensis]
MTAKVVDDTSVRVALRIRPQSASEQIDMCRVCTSCTPGHPQVVLGKDKGFTFDYVFDIPAKQPEIYEKCVKELVEGCLDGYNATVLAYGQTGAGKTYTMGTGFDVNIDPLEEGIVPRAVGQLFSGIERRRQEAKQRNEPQPDFKVTVQFMELYNEDLIDLFDADGRGRKSHHVKIHEDTNGQIYTVGVNTRAVKSALDTLNALQQGALSRTTASTNMNTHSSRSHAIFTIHIKQQRVVKISNNEPTKGGEDYEYEMLSAKFNFVDLAGSERLKRTGATGDRAKEGISINCGLLALGNVISALGDVTKKGSHVPYRDSKLTRLLQDSLGGNSCTLMIACVSPSDRDFMETLNTLKYANRARNIKNKVSVNQDKASKQISMLRAEIQKLTAELVEFRQGRRVSSGEGESDVSLENNMLRNENEKLRLRIKGLQSTVEVQSNRITNLMSGQVVAALDGIQVDGGVESLIQKYLREIEELRNKLTESEAMAMAITRHASMKSRLGSPMHLETSSVLEMAKMDVARQKQKAQKLQRDNSQDENTNEESKEEGSEADQSDEEAVEEDEDDDDEDNDDEDDDDTAEVHEENEQVSSDDDSTDEKEDEDEEKVEGELAALTTDIEIKQKLIEELEIAQNKIQTMRSQYEEKLVLLTHKIKETEEERDHVLKNIKEHDSESSKQAAKLKEEYEKKLGGLQTELKKVQAAKKEHAQLIREKANNDMRLKQLSNEVSDMKKTKARLMKQMKDEVAKNKQRESARNKEIAQLKKVSRMREIAIKNLESEKRQKDIILRRKQEEVKALRRQQKPVSGSLGAKKNQVTAQPIAENGYPQESYPVAPSGYGTYGYRGSTVAPERPGGPPRTRIPGRGPRKRMTIEQATKSAKKKWDFVDKKVMSLVMHKQTISNLEKDYDRWVEDREKLSKDMETCRTKLQEAATGDEQTQLREQMEALTAHMEYVQDNIDSCQACIMEMEDPGNTMTELSELMTSSTLQEARILLDHFLTRTVTQCQELSAKDATVKELENRLEVTKQHNYLQQELLHHVLQQKDVTSSLPYSTSIEDLANADVDTLSDVNEFLRASTGSLQSVGTVDGTDVGLSSSSASALQGDRPGKPKARRRTGLPEEFLHPDRKTRRAPSLPSLKSGESDNNSSMPLVPVGPTDFKSSKQISPELMQKLLELDKARKSGEKMERDNNDNPMPPPTSSKMPRVNSMNVGHGNAVVPASMTRGNLRSKSARSFPSSKFGPVPAASNNPARSQPTSPALPRKASMENRALENGDESGKNNNSDDVFSRLTSSLGQESDPDVGRMLPLRPPSGKPTALVCTYAATGHNSAVLSVDVTEDFMFTGSKDKTVKVWDLNTGEEILSLSGHKRDVVAVKYCHNTNCVYSVAQNLIKMWDVRQDSGKCIKTLTPQAGSTISGFISGITSDTQINDLQISDHQLFAAMGNSVRIWDLKTFSMTGKLSGHAAPVMTIKLKKRESDTLVFTGSRDHFVKIYELSESNVGVQSPTYSLAPPHYDGVQCITIRGTSLYSGSRDNSIKKWDYETHQLQQHVTGAHKDWVCAIDHLPKREVLLSGCRGGYLKLWTVDTCQPICEIRAHRHPINAIATNSSCVFTASNDRLVRLWRATGTLDDQLQEIRRAIQV